ncbi:metallophosphoesterase [Salipaludibacillus sp. HK11]|uniref:metallophosphoesterase n=1 Tax=Salipaludibacillus sp. HK11 TaxID=3394320 RepID=UPI0039FD4B87
MNPFLKKLGIIFIVIGATILFSYYQNNFLTTTSIDVISNDIPDEFDGYKIVQLSDLHSKWFGSNQENLVERVKKENPDLIVFTGDLIDEKSRDVKPGLVLMEHVTSIAPTYYVTGNHEWWANQTESIEEELTNLGVRVLRNDKEEIERNGESLTLLGIDDPAEFEGGYVEESSIISSIEQALDDKDHTDHFTILLSHRPEMFSIYQDFELDLTFSGHAHGGQFRIPFVGGIVAPGQGWFPKYTAGKYDEKGSTLIVNRGLGNSIIPQRIFNRPEVTSVTLRKIEE